MNIFIAKKNVETNLYILWAHLGSNQGPPDYESGALTN